MPTVYVIAEQPAEHSAIASLLCRNGYATESFRDVPSFLDEATRDLEGCVILDLLPTRASVGAMPSLLTNSDPLPTIVISSRANVELAVRAMKEGAADFLERPIKADRLISSVRDALAESRVRQERLRRTRELVSRYQTLSLRERDVVDAVLEGHGNKQVASLLGICARTVEAHRSNAMIKMGARTIADLVRIWLDLDAAALR